MPLICMLKWSVHLHWTMNISSTVAAVMFCGCQLCVSIDGTAVWNGATGFKSFQV